MPGSPAVDPTSCTQGLTRRWRVLAGVTTEIECKPMDDALPEIVHRILLARGMTDPAEREAYLRPKLTELHDPSLIPDLDRAAERLLRAIDDGEPIVIYGDYDVDGITATAILYHMLKTIRPDADVRTFVPHRIDDGYGINTKALEELAEAGARVVVSVDCGITALEPATASGELGIDLIITDHHNPPETAADLPQAFAVVHPRRPDSAYPFGELPGAGVAYKLAWRLATMRCGSERVTDAMRTLLVELLAFAAMGVIADIVPLVGENRVLARFGLGRIKTSSFTGLRALVEQSGLAGEEVDAIGVGFRLGPRLNAAGRMDHAQEAVELFTTADAGRAQQIAEALNHRNEQRRNTERAILDHAAQLAVERGMTSPDRRAIVLAHEDWHPGVVGIVCSRLVEKFGRPALLMQRNGRRDQICRGSGRSIDVYNLHAGLVHCDDLLESYGGHDMAAGMAVHEDNFDAFVERFTSHANEHITVDDLTPEIRVDCESTVEELTVENVSAIERLAPFGRGNPSVHLLLRGVTIMSDPRPIGQTNKHLAFNIRGTNRFLRVIGWDWGEHRERVHKGMTVDVVVRPKLSRFNGRVSVEPELKDLRIVPG